MLAVVNKKRKKGRGKAGATAGEGGGYDVSEFQPAFGGGGTLGADPGAFPDASKVAETERMIQAQNQLAEAEAARSNKLRETLRLQKMQDVANKKSQVSLEALKATTLDMATNALGQLAGGMWAAADAAIQSQQGFGAAILGMTKGILLGIAQQAAVQAVFHLAAGFGAQGFTMGAPNPSSVSHFTAAAIFGGISAGTGAAGLAISAATAPSGGAGASGGSASGRNSAPGSQRQSFGTRKKQEERPIVVELYLGDRGNRAAALLARKQLQTQLGSA
jgi:hypothetical protein